jgi:hypothetical protein
MRLFRRLPTREYPTIRDLSDSSSWLYVAHLPLVIGGQNMIQDWPIPAGIKFALLNGRRQRTHSTASSICEGKGHHDASQR